MSKPLSSLSHSASPLGDKLRASSELVEGMVAGFFHGISKHLFGVTRFRGATRLRSGRLKKIGKIGTATNGTAVAKPLSALDLRLSEFLSWT